MIRRKMDNKITLNSWKDAETFDDLCILMQKSLTENFNSFMSGICDCTNCVLVPESIPYRDDYMRLNNLGFLTTNSQPGTIESYSIDDDTRMLNSVKKLIKRKKYNIEDYIEVYEQREYIIGFLNKNTIQKIVPLLKDYIICIEPFNCQKKIISRDYDCKLESDLLYIFFPKDFDESLHDSSCVMSASTSNSALFDEHCFINLSRTVYSPIVLSSSYETRQDETIMEHWTNVNFLEDYTGFEIDYYIKDLKPKLKKYVLENTYNLTIVNPKYGYNGLSKLLISLLI